MYATAVPKQKIRRDISSTLPALRPANLTVTSSYLYNAVLLQDSIIISIDTTVRYADNINRSIPNTIPVKLIANGKDRAPGRCTFHSL